MLETFQDRLVTELHLAAASTIGEEVLVLQEFLLEASRGVPAFPGERSGRELLQFWWSWSCSASELLVIRVIAFRMVGPLDLAGLAAATCGVGVVLQGHLHLREGLVLAGGIVSA